MLSFEVWEQPNVRHMELTLLVSDPDGKSFYRLAGPRLTPNAICRVGWTLSGAELEELKERVDKALGRREN